MPKRRCLFQQFSNFLQITNEILTLISPRRLIGRSRDRCGMHGGQHMRSEIALENLPSISRDAKALADEHLRCAGAETNQNLWLDDI